MVSRRHDTVAIHLQDEREHTLPALGLVNLTDPETGHPFLIDTGSRQGRRAFAHAANTKCKELLALFRRAGVDQVTVRCGEDYVEPLARFFRARSKAA